MLKHNAFLRLIRYDIPWFFRNIWNFRKTLWVSRPWDWVGLYQSMYDALKGMEEQQRVYGSSVNSNEYAKDICICLKLLERLIADDYLTKGFKYPPYKGMFSKKWSTKDPNSLYSQQPSYREGFKIRLSNQRADRELLFKLMARKSQGWWD